jgi:hypothetical protein
LEYLEELWWVYNSIDEILVQINLLPSEFCNRANFDLEVIIDNIEYLLEDESGILLLKKNNYCIGDYRDLGNKYSVLLCKEAC